jgi:putative RecB family exonuclease
MQAAKQIQDELYVSYSQLFTYSACSLKYKYQYVEQRSLERISSALPFGKATHAALEIYYRDIQDNGNPPQLERMLAVFCASLLEQINNSEIPVIYKKEAPDLEAMLTMGEALIRTFYKEVDITGYEIVGVEVPLSAPLYSEDKEQLDIKLFGVLDLLLKDKSGNLLCIDNKTSKQKKSQSAVNEDVQLTAYSYLLAANGFTFPRAQIQCRFDVLRKLKNPTIEYYYTTRTAEDRRRFAKLTSHILQGIENRIFFPNASWLCADCQFKDICKDW